MIPASAARAPSPPAGAVKARAREIGFDRLGICAPDPPPEAALFRNWLARGFHGRMEYLARGAGPRLDPGALLPGVRSILVGAVRYGPHPRPAPRPLSGEVSCYAWGEDYHRVVGEMASLLASFIREGWGARTVEHVDTGPVLERLWAALAGVGWIGKNSLVLDRDLGSYVFLAVVLTDLDLPPDEPALDQCGSCALCVEACPTGAIVEPRVVDSRRCLSYDTIELRGAFPEEHREALGARVFGCDDCQTACPWNREGPAPRAEFLPRPSEEAPDLPALLGMAMPEYTRRFRGSAMKRATFHGLRRNAAVALGNVLSGRAGGDPRREPPDAAERSRALDALRRATADADPGVAQAARWGLDRARDGGG